MKQTINEHQFRQAFKECRPDQFSWEGLHALWEWFEQYEEDTSEDIELDVIAICCDYSEYKNIEELQGDYGTEYTMENLIDMTTVISIENTEGFIIQQF